MEGASFARTEELQCEWNALRDEMEALVSSIAKRSSAEKTARKAELSVRMTAITAEMADLLSAAKQSVSERASVSDSASPSLNESNDKENAGLTSSTTAATTTSPCLPGARHTVERTYSSSNSETSGAEKCAQTECQRVGTPVGSAAAAESAAVAGRRARDERTVLTALGTRLRTTLKSAVGGAKKGSGNSADVGNDEDAQGNSDTGSVSEEERERAAELKLEMSRLERQLRALRRKAREESTEEDENEARKIQARLDEIADTALDARVKKKKTELPEQEDAEQRTDRKCASASAGGSTAMQKEGKGSSTNFREKSTTPFSPRRWVQAHSPRLSGKLVSNAHARDSAVADNDRQQSPVAAASAAQTAPKNAHGSSPLAAASPSRRAWASIRALSKTFRSTQSQNQSQTSATSGAVSPAAAAASARDGNVYAEVKERLERREEDLNRMNEASAQMADSANDLLAAARALRKKKTSRSAFFS